MFFKTQMTVLELVLNASMDTRYKLKTTGN